MKEEQPGHELAYEMPVLQVAALHAMPQHQPEGFFLFGFCGIFLFVVVLFCFLAHLKGNDRELETERRPSYPLVQTAGGHSGQEWSRSPTCVSHPAGSWVESKATGT